jgi:hypothetical protein
MVRSAQDQKPHGTHTAPIAPGREPVFVLGVARAGECHQRQRATAEEDPPVPGSVFDALAEDYDAARPAYPDGLYRALEYATGRLLAQITGLVGGRFPDGRMSVPHRTRMWLARRRLRPAAG